MRLTARIAEDHAAPVHTKCCSRPQGREHGVYRAPVLVQELRVVARSAVRDRIRRPDCVRARAGIFEIGLNGRVPPVLGLRTGAIGADECHD